MRTRGMAAAWALVAALAVAGPSQAQGVLGGLLGQPARAGSAASVSARGAGYLGVTVEPAPDGRRRYAIIASVDPGSPAAAAGLQPGDELINLVQNQRTVFNQKGVTVSDQASLDAWLASEGPEAPQWVQYRRSGKILRTAVVLAAAPPTRLKSAGADPARAAYQQLCGSAAPSLSAATCQGMKRDLDRAASAAGAADVASAYNQLCAPGAEKLSRETCAAMRREAGGAPAGPVRSAATELASAYQELCGPGAAQVSAETCASLKADAASRAAPHPKPKTPQKARRK